MTLTDLTAAGRADRSEQIGRLRALIVHGAITHGRIEEHLGIDNKIAA